MNFVDLEIKPLSTIRSFSREDWSETHNALEAEDIFLSPRQDPEELGASLHVCLPYVQALYCLGLAPDASIQIQVKKKCADHEHRNRVGHFDLESRSICVSQDDGSMPAQSALLHELGHFIDSDAGSRMHAKSGAFFSAIANDSGAARADARAALGQLDTAFRGLASVQKLLNGPTRDAFVSASLSPPEVFAESFAIYCYERAKGSGKINGAELESLRPASLNAPLDGAFGVVADYDPAQVDAVCRALEGVADAMS